ncbi:MAG: phosphoribosylformylglycinamidine synthase subunit PurL, partial [Candidatus Poribacteria bacterium]|nr:phosphoribosylformylglycinamidine synthase subunit PurL [Candidatus Poribacteria bacterium]
LLPQTMKFVLQKSSMRKSCIHKIAEKVMSSTVKEIEILNADDTELMRISREGTLSLNLNEMHAIQSHFEGLGRNPTDVEIETIAQTWSEHCVHKTFKSIIDYAEPGKEPERIDGLFPTFIQRATEEIAKPWCVSVFSDNAGIIEFDDTYNLVFKVETHNHPSAIEPYGGAGTGIGGVIRDSLGTGLGAKPILNTDVFCFGMPDTPYAELPKGTLHPKRVFNGVVAGVRDYGNRMGIPTANGAILFDTRYTANPLVFCGNVGLIPRNRCEKSVEPGDLVVSIGGQTGRDGIHGATFSSAELDDTSENLGSVVQIGNPIMEKKIVDALLQARDRNLYRSITDCGAGGFSSAVGEMGEHIGAEVHLERVSLKYEGLAPWEIWLSEAQERMVIAVPPDNLDELIEICEAEFVEATVLGRFTDTHRLQVFYEGSIVGDLEMEFLHNGLPQPIKQAVWDPPNHPEMPSRDKEAKDYTDDLWQLLASPNIASKESVIRQYDHSVQGGIVIHPLVGVENDGPSDACVVTPVIGSRNGVIVANGINPKYSDVDPYLSAAAAIDEALRNIIAVGGTLEKTALLDNFCWGNPDKPDRLGELVRAARACYDIATAYGTPFISGKDSLYNEYSDTTTGEQRAIPATLLISAICVMLDIRRTVTMDVKTPDNYIYVIGNTYAELGGSHYFGIHGFIGNNAPIVRPDEGKLTMERLSAAINKGLVRSCHDCSEGGIGVAAAEMAFSGGYGMSLNLGSIPTGEEITADDMLLFSESNSRFLVEVEPQHQQAYETLMKGIPTGCLGTVTDSPNFIVNGIAGHQIVETSIDTLKSAWQAPLFF